MSKISLVITACIVLLSACDTSSQRSTAEELRQQVMDTERAFAQTMADRDFEAFVSFLSEEAVFFSGETPTHGRQQVAEQWKPFFEKPEAPFSWKPETVEVLDSGTLALSSGPVHAAGGKLVATFTSIWQLESPGKWRIIFDKGNQVCDSPEP